MDPGVLRGSYADLRTHKSVFYFAAHGKRSGNTVQPAAAAAAAVRNAEINGNVGPLPDRRLSLADRWALYKLVSRDVDEPYPFFPCLPLREQCNA